MIQPLVSPLPYAMLPGRLVPRDAHHLALKVYMEPMLPWHPFLVSWLLATSVGVKFHRGGNSNRGILIHQSSLVIRLLLW